MRFADAVGCTDWTTRDTFPTVISRAIESTLAPPPLLNIRRPVGLALSGYTGRICVAEPPLE